MRTPLSVSSSQMRCELVVLRRRFSGNFAIASYTIHI